jgi:hypothetical protein
VLVPFRRLLAEAAPFLVTGFVRGTPRDEVLTGLDRGWVPLRYAADARGVFLTEHERLSDAFVLQLVPVAVGDALQGNGRWRVSATANAGLVLLEHRDVDAWLSAPLPDAAVLEQARDDLDRFLVREVDIVQARISTGVSW